MSEQAPGVESPLPDPPGANYVGATRLKGLPIIVISTGDRQGEVEAALFNAAAGRLVGLTARRGGSFLRAGEILVLREADIRSIGPDAVTIEIPTVLKEGPAAEQELAAEAGESPMSKRVVTHSGKFVGTVDDIIMDRTTRRIAAYKISGGIWENMKHGRVDLRVEHVISVGKDAMVIQDVL